MGQLEKYGLYVLCLVIFMILGVTIWGGDEGSPQRGASSMRVAAGDPPARSAKAEVPAPKVEPSADILAMLRGDQGGDGRRSGAGSAPAPAPAPAAVNVGEPSPAAAKPTGDGANAAPAAGGAPVAAASARTTYKVQPGDSFEAIAKKHLGNAALTAELQRLNPGIESHKLRVGTNLVLPAAGELAKGDARSPVAKADGAKADAPKSDAGAKAAADKSTPPVRGAVAAERRYVIHKGDTLEGIARAELGSSKRVDVIRQMNPTLDPTRLKIGTSIKLPAK